MVYSPNKIVRSLKPHEIVFGTFAQTEHLFIDLVLIIGLVFSVSSPKRNPQPHSHHTINSGGAFNAI